MQEEWEKMQGLDPSWMLAPQGMRKTGVLGSGEAGGG